ncbi:hypothetical protein HT031_006369 [Scenedesmus sp. PABB004]|nr:hypothetical protein HT031_006369 [Scenedesmus sp. PABB004]
MKSFVAVALCAMLVFAASTEAVRPDESVTGRQLQAALTTIAGCATYRTWGAGRRTCTACTGGLIPGPVGDRCIRSTTTVVGRPGVGVVGRPAVVGGVGVVRPGLVGR